MNKCKISFSKDKYVEFKNYICKQPLPFVVYADFESRLPSVNDPKPTEQSNKYQSHEAIPKDRQLMG